MVWRASAARIMERLCHPIRFKRRSSGLILTFATVTLTASPSYAQTQAPAARGEYDKIVTDTGAYTIPHRFVRTLSDQSEIQLHGDWGLGLGLCLPADEPGAYGANGDVMPNLASIAPWGGGPISCPHALVTIMSIANPSVSTPPSTGMKNLLQFPGTGSYDYREKFDMIEMTPKLGSPGAFKLYFGAKYFNAEKGGGQVLFRCLKEWPPMTNHICDGHAELSGLKLGLRIQLDEDRLDRLMWVVAAAARVISADNSK